MITRSSLRSSLCPLRPTPSIRHSYLSKSPFHSLPSTGLRKPSPLQRTTLFFSPPSHRRFLSTETRSAISRAISSSPVVLFMKGTPETPQCGFSRTTIQILGLQGVDPAKFTAFNVLEDPELRNGIKEYSDWPTIPQLYVGEEFVGGCDILMGMHKDGTLADLLAEKGVLVQDGEGDGGGEGVKKS